MKINTTTFVEITDLIPKKFRPDFFQQLAESDVDITWGSNNRTLIDPEFLFDACNDCLADDWEGKKVCIKALAEVVTMVDGPDYIDMEN